MYYNHAERKTRGGGKKRKIMSINYTATVAINYTTVL
jgi:hypothetical protein